MTRFKGENMKALIILSTLLLSPLALADIDWTTYSDKALAQAQARGEKVVLGFHKRGCGTCHAQDQSLEDAGIKNVKGVTFLKVERKNSDHTKVYEKYGLSSRQWAAIILLKDDREIARIAPGTTNGPQVQNLVSKATR
jgi:thiol-disulfide isomerase/thioredoxin